MATPNKAEKHDIPYLPEGLRTEFEVCAQKGRTGQKTWLLRDLATRQRYILTPASIEGWKIDPKPKKHMSHSIIVVCDDQSVIAMELSSGIFFCDRAPPAKLRMK